MFSLHRYTTRVCVFSALLLAGCGKPQPAPETAAAASPTPAPGIVAFAPDAPELKQMSIEPVRTVNVPADEITATARIEANPSRVGHAMLPVPGRIVRVLVKLGDAVTQGQPVVEIESPTVAELEAGFLQSESGVSQAELALAKADADLARLTDLYQHQAVAQKEVLGAQTASALSKAQLEQARTAREQARRRVQLLGLKPGQFQQHVFVPAPISGKVLELSVADGEFRNEINASLLTIADLSRVWATSEVPESKIRYCKPGGMATLDLIAYPNEVFRARVTRIADTVNPDTRTIKVSAELDNPNGRLRPEMFGRVHYADGQIAAPWVPDSAIIRIGSKDFVFVEQAPGRFLSAPIELGSRYDGGFAVASGLKSGQRVVTAGSVYLKAAL